MSGPLSSTPAKVGVAVGVAGLALYLYLKSKTSYVFEDVRDIIKLLGLKKTLTALAEMKEWSVVDMWNDALYRKPNGEAIYYVDTGATYTFKQVEEISNRVANWARSVGIKQGDVVALLMDNRPEFIFTWLGLAKVGAIAALINTNLTGRPLIHSLSVCKADRFVIGIEHADRGKAGKEALNRGNWYSYGGEVEGFEHLDDTLSKQDTAAPPASCRAGINASSTLFYIYTSGTTGAPKASIIKHLRFYSIGLAFCETYNINAEDRIYCTLPLYHSAGGMIGVGMHWYKSATLVLRRKFSASQFWHDVHNHKCSVIQYIGELCRYLLAVPKQDVEKKLNVKIAIGNGLRPDIWEEFQSRFNIQNIGEFYGATEGNAALLNTKNQVGSVGYVSPLIANVYPVKLVKFDIETETPIRGPDGLCIECGPGQVGELLGKIDNTDPTRRFDGYTDKKATSKKVLCDVFEKGDKWFRSGDLLEFDSNGFYYFKDRIGDTFRWKGENVATSEVQLVASSAPGVFECNVYGVEVRGHDGRAGMASIVVQKDFTLDGLYTKVTSELPNYARPLFLRLKREMEITGTFKHKKVDLQKEGFDPAKVKDALYFRNDKLKKFVPIDANLYQQIQNGTIDAKL